MPGTVSVIVSSYNQSQSVCQIIDRLREQAYADAIPCQAVIADDGSNKTECDIINNAIASIPRSSLFSATMVWQPDKGFRLAKAWNNGLKKSVGDIIVMTNGDCLPDEGFLKSHLAVHKNMPKGIICVGSRKFRPPFEAPCEVKRPCSAEIEKKLKQLEEYEAYTIKTKSQSATPWRAVLGRNFSFPRLAPLPLFEEMLFGWGGDDLGYAIELFNGGLKTVVYNELASVTQIDDLKNSASPLDCPSQAKIAYTQANFLLLMRKHTADIPTYVELSNYLNYFSFPYVYKNGEFCPDEERKKSILTAFSNDEGLSLAQAKKLYEKTASELYCFFQQNPSIMEHPAMHILMRPQEPEPSRKNETLLRQEIAP